MLALQQAIDKAVYSLVMEGVDLKLWGFADPAAGWPALWRYNQERDGVLTADQVLQADRRAHPGRAVRRPANDPPPMPAQMAAARRAPPPLTRLAPPAGLPAPAQANARAEPQAPAALMASNSPAQNASAHETTAAARVVADMVGRRPTE